MTKTSVHCELSQACYDQDMVALTKKYLWGWGCELETDPYDGLRG